jgi:hypothetical protein
MRVRDLLKELIDKRDWEITLSDIVREDGEWPDYQKWEIELGDFSYSEKKIQLNKKYRVD